MPNYLIMRFITWSGAVLAGQSRLVKQRDVTTEWRATDTDDDISWWFNKEKTEE